MGPRHSPSRYSAAAANSANSRLNSTARSMLTKWPIVQPRVDNLVALANGANVDVGWLATGNDSPQPSEAFPSVPLYDAEASAGHGSFVDYAPIKDRIPFTDDFLLRRLGRTNADGLICVYARGDSMEPTIRNGDIIMVDMKQKALTSAIFAVTSEYGFWVKRLNPGVEGIEVVSDNPSYKPMNIRHDLMEPFEILGRVVWVGHTL